MIANIATIIAAGHFRSRVCPTIFLPLDSNATHVEYLMPAPTGVADQDKAIVNKDFLVHIQKKGEPEKTLYYNPEQRQRGETEEFAKTLEEAHDTDIQEKCMSSPDSIKSTHKIKTLSDVKRHDERPVREVKLLENKGIIGYEAKRPEFRHSFGGKNQFSPGRGSKQYTQKKPMTLSDLPKADLNVQEETQSFRKVDGSRIQKIQNKNQD